jgi:hypothetical protein
VPWMDEPERLHGCDGDAGDAGLHGRTLDAPVLTKTPDRCETPAQARVSACLPTGETGLEPATPVLEVRAIRA